MLKQPKGLIAAALANTGERFGFYTMMAILTLFLMSKFGIDGEQAGKIYSFFLYLDLHPGARRRPDCRPAAQL